MNYIRLLWTFFRVSAMNAVQYRANFYVQMIQSLLSLGIGLAGLGLVFSHTSDLAGWRPAELLAVLGVYMLVAGVIHLVVQPSLQRFMEDVRQGTLDFTLTKPEDSQLLVSWRELEVWKLVDLGLGVATLGVALWQLERGIGPWQALAFGIVLIAGAVIVYSFLFVLATCVFWFVKVENILVIFESMYQAGRWPVGIYPGWLRAALTFLVPVAFAVTVPAEAFTGRASWQVLLGAVALATVLLAGCRWFWKIGVRHYSGASA